MTEKHDQKSAQSTIDGLQEEFGREFMARAESGRRPQSFPSLRRSGVLVAVLAAVGVGAGVAVAASTNGDQPEPEILPVVGAMMSPAGKVVTFDCQAESDWFFTEVGTDSPAFTDPDVEMPKPPEGICDGQPPLTQTSSP